MTPWPSGPDGKPLPRDTNGTPLWPSESYRQAYESGQAQHRAAADARWKVWQVILVVVVLAWIVFFLSHQ